MVDTSLFEGPFVHRLLSTIEDLDSNVGGVTIHGDNFQGIGLLTSRRQSVAGIYIDPPYNTDASPIIYKNGYQHSSWASLFRDRMRHAINLLHTEEIGRASCRERVCPYV